MKINRHKTYIRHLYFIFTLIKFEFYTIIYKLKVISELTDIILNFTAIKRRILR